MRQLLQLFDFGDVIEEDDNFPPIVDQGCPQLDVVGALPQAFLLKYVVRGPRILIEKAFVLYEFIEGRARLLHLLVYRCIDVATS